MKRELLLAVLALLAIFLPTGSPVHSLVVIALLGTATWVVLDRGVDAALSFWNRWISP